jgi:hypothetical protein
VQYASAQFVVSRSAENLVSTHSIAEFGDVSFASSLIALRFGWQLAIRRLSTPIVEYLMKAKLFVLALAALNAAPVMAKTLRDYPPGPGCTDVWAWVLRLFGA